MPATLPKITFIFDRYSKATPSTEATVEMRITYNRKQKYISTGITILPKHWKRGTIVNRSDAIQLNEILNDLLTKTRQIILDMAKENNIDIFAIPKELESLKKERLSFIDFCKQRSEVRKYGKTKDSQLRYNRFLRLFNEWGKIREFEDINEANIIAYDKYLISTKLKPYSKWNNYHRFLNSFISDAISEGYLNNNPYKKLNIQRYKDTKGIEKYLTPIEFKRLKNTVMPTQSLERIKDLFIFQTYTCLSYSDLSRFDVKFITTIKDIKVYTGNRQKTNKSFTIPLLKEPLEILKKYNNKLPIISNEKYNQYLKIVAQASGIDKPLSSHWARHTGATLLLNEGVDMKIVSKICGHSSTRITEQVYAKLLDETVVDAISNITI